MLKDRIEESRQQFPVSGKGYTWKVNRLQKSSHAPSIAPFNERTGRTVDAFEESWVDQLQYRTNCAKENQRHHSTGLKTVKIQKSPLDKRAFMKKIKLSKRLNQKKAPSELQITAQLSLSSEYNSSTKLKCEEPIEMQQNFCHRAKINRNYDRFRKKHLEKLQQPQILSYRPLQSVCGSGSEESCKPDEEVGLGILALESSNSKHSGDDSTVSANNSNSLQQGRHRQEYVDNQVSDALQQLETPETAPVQTRATVSAQHDPKSTKLTTYSEASTDTMASCQATEKLEKPRPKTSYKVRRSENATNV